LEDENGEEAKEDENMELQDDMVPDEREIPTRSSEEVAGNKKHGKDDNERTSGQPVDEEGQVEMCVEVDGDKVDTLGASRGNETTFHTVPGEMLADTCQQKDLSPGDYCALRSELQSQLASWSQVSIQNDSSVHTDRSFL
jgi:hypothetical protein